LNACIDYEKKVEMDMVNHSYNNKKTNKHLKLFNAKNIHDICVWDRLKYGVGLNQLMKSQPSPS
jgi:hypothetical protein